ncbi:TPA: hypothetical protein GXX44_06320 [bacterium]|nr:hypothetical protein [bacterium]
MELPEIKRKLESFLEEIERVKSRFFPSLNLIIIRNLFDTYYNAENDRKDFAIIYQGKRILGYDNLGEWHKHPFENPDSHLKCEEPEIEEIFREILDILDRVRKDEL